MSGTSSWYGRAVSQVSAIPLRGNRVVTTIEAIASLTSILLFVGAVVGLFGDGPVWATVLVVWMLMITTTLIGVLVLQERRIGRRLRYAVSLESLHHTTHLIRDAEASVLNHGSSTDQVLPTMQAALASFARTFTLICGSPCRACIKEVHYPDATLVPVTSENLRDLRVSTLCRDELFGPNRADSTEHFVTDNTDFELLFMKRNKYRWFHSNDLSTVHPYKNSNWTDDSPRDYNSTCVWPIQKSADSGNQHETLGFLCIDSLDVDVFDPRFDFHVGAAIADSFYPLLKLMRLRTDGALG